ncbi:MAG: hypothetical protein EXQ91_03215 [Alphaproteobacteria bacterium]|nr:hypothetical protein [Alphaproteobacteria bacterium]
MVVRRGVAVLGLALALAASGSLAQQKVTPNEFGPKQAHPAAPSPVETELKDADIAPGLAVSYWKMLIRDVQEVANMVGKRKPEVGRPLNHLNYKMGTGKVLTSNLDDGVGAEILGFIKLDKTGQYVFVANSNDGVRVEVGGEKIIEDPDVHSDRFSPAGKVDVTKPGWYALRVLYFERKSEATLQLYWKEPDGADYVIVPDKAFARKK